MRVRSEVLQVIDGVFVLLTPLFQVVFVCFVSVLDLSVLFCPSLQI